MNAKKIKQRLRGEADRKAHSLHLSQTIFNEFKELCGPISASRVIEEFMREFVDDLKSKPRVAILKKAANKKN